ncbi:MAG TPA: hypothetical protein VNO70_25570, partial [Blastocatellia bacterium]|nr:hypothetical protein [Blastocatellia bacterium]
IRSGVITASVGFGVKLSFLLVGISLKQEALFFPAGAGLVLFLIGLGLVINGLVFSLPRKYAFDHSPEARAQRVLDQLSGPAAITDGDLASANPIAPPSVTEHTTHQLSDKPETAHRARLREG